MDVLVLVCGRGSWLQIQMSLMMCYMKRLNIISDIVLADDVEQILVWGGGR